MLDMGGERTHVSSDASDEGRPCAARYFGVAFFQICCQPLVKYTLVESTTRKSGAAPSATTAGAARLAVVSFITSGWTVAIVILAPRARGADEEPTKPSP